MSRFPAWHNPVPGWLPTRVDQGVDGTLSRDGFRAPFKCRILHAVDHSPGWDNGGYIAAEILYGPFKGQGFFVAEGIRPVVQPGQIIPKGGIQIARRANNPYNGVLGNIEVGWVAPDGLRPLAQTFTGYSGDQSLAAITAGGAMNLFIEQCGGTPGHYNVRWRPDWALLPSGLRHALGV